MDRHGRLITDLRVSVTDRCNYRCVYLQNGNEGAQYSELMKERHCEVFIKLGAVVDDTGPNPIERIDW
jgi:cyclic pyranopterin phosphate synthase